MPASTTAHALATWELDAAHSSVEFSVKHMMMTTVRGRFTDVKATLTGNEAHPTACCVTVEIATASIDTGAPDRDTHLRSADFFDAARFPTIRFVSTRLDGDFEKEGDRFRAAGKLTMHDAELDLVLDCVFEGRGRDPWGKERAGFSAHTEIDRRDWGLKWNQAMETGGVLVANKVRIDVEAQFVRQG